MLSYGSVRSTFLPDTDRGYWAHPSDFVYAGIGLAFHLDVFKRTWTFDKYLHTIDVLLTYFINLFIYIIPFILLQSYLGQFSSSSYISAFRFAPLFKGIGYVSLVLNVCTVSLHSIFATMPLIYMFASIQPNMPWSCEGFKKWATNLTEGEQINLCNLYLENETNTLNETDNIKLYIPSVLYFYNIFNNDIDLVSYGFVQFFMSWKLILCDIFIWLLMILFTYKFFDTERFGQIIRYTVWLLSGLLLLFLIRFSFLPGAKHVYRQLTVPTWLDIYNSFLDMPFYSLSAFGPGWGVFIALSSFNKFKTNILRQSWFIGFGQLVIVIGLHFLNSLIEQYIYDITDYKYHYVLEPILDIYLCTASVISHMEWANMWSILFYFMLFLSSMLSILIQLYTILITIFDEFVTLREFKLEVCIGLITTIAIMSLYFTSNHGVTHRFPIMSDIYITQIAINLLLLFIVLWIYGSVHFKRDIEFMINTRVSTWQVNILKYVAPLGMLVAFIIGVQLAYIEHTLADSATVIMVIIFIIIPWLLIPGYAVYIMRQSSGSFKERFQRFCKLKDWHPIEEEDRSHYEDALANIDITYQLNEINDKNVS